MQNIAAIDVGSNAVRLVIGAVDDRWDVAPIEYIRVPIRLGADVFKNKSIEPDTIHQMVETFHDFRQWINEFGVSTMRAVGTSALREAGNSQALIDQIAQASGIELEVIDPEEEARLVYLAVSQVVDLRDKCSLLVDIGGGSVEMILATNGRLLSSQSYELGTVRLLEQANGKAHTESAEEMSTRLQDLARTRGAQLEEALGQEKIDICVATGGNVEEIGKLRLKLLERQGESLVTVKELKEMIDRLSQMSYSERISKLDMRPDRADVILPASIVLNLVANACHVSEIRIPQVGLKNGLLKDLANHMAENYIPPNRDQIWESALSLGKKFKFDQAHACFVARLAGQLFDQTEQLHSMDAEEKWILELGSLLHAIGIFINIKDHDRHGFYILNANPIYGLTERQQAMVACLVLFHKSDSLTPDLFSPPLLSEEESICVIKLCALLRLADAMDVGHAQRVTDISLTRHPGFWCLHLNGKGNLWREKWSIQKRSLMFQKAFEVRLEID